jgi:hypothetical protein
MARQQSATGVAQQATVVVVLRCLQQFERALELVIHVNDCEAHGWEPAEKLRQERIRWRRDMLDRVARGMSQTRIDEIRSHMKPVAWTDADQARLQFELPPDGSRPPRPLQRSAVAPCIRRSVPARSRGRASRSRRLVRRARARSPGRKQAASDPDGIAAAIRRLLARVRPPVQADRP